MFFHPVFIKIYVGEFYSISSIHFLVLFSLVIGSIQKACECAQNVWYCILYKNIKNCLTIIPYTQKLYSQTICSGQCSAAIREINISGRRGLVAKLCCYKTTATTQVHNPAKRKFSSFVYCLCLEGFRILAFRSQMSNFLHVNPSQIHYLIIRKVLTVKFYITIRDDLCKIHKESLLLS